jgi:hypothetical protein
MNKDTTTCLTGRENSTVTSTSWIEPDDASDSAEDSEAATKGIRADFAGWRRYQSVLLPTEITRRVGGKAHFSIDVSKVLINEELSNTLFQNSN